MTTIKNRGAKSNLLSLYLKENHLGKVHSKFGRGLNIQFDDFLIYISNDSSSLSAFGLNIEEEKLIDLLDSMNIGDVVVNKDGKLIFYSVYEIIIIDYQNIDELDLRLPSINCKKSRIVHTKLYKYLETIKFKELIGLELDEKTCHYIDLLLNTDKSDESINSDIIKFFTGRGRGLTPSGDDILIGFTLALMIYDDYSSWKESIQLEMTEQMTTIISVAYQRALLNGFISEYYLLLVKLLDEDEAIDEIIKNVQSVGHTSGNDTLYGFYLGLKFISNN